MKTCVSDFGGNIVIRVSNSHSPLHSDVCVCIHAALLFSIVVDRLVYMHVYIWLNALLFRCQCNNDQQGGWLKVNVHLFGSPINITLMYDALVLAYKWLIVHCIDVATNRIIGQALEPGNSYEWDKAQLFGYSVQCVQQPTIQVTFNSNQF